MVQANEDSDRDESEHQDGKREILRSNPLRHGHTCSPAVAFIPHPLPSQFLLQRINYCDARTFMDNTFLAVLTRALSPTPPRRSQKEDLTFEEGHAQCEQGPEG